MASRARAPTPGPRARSPDRDGSLAGRRSRTPPPRQICRCRRRFRTTATSKTSAPSVGSSRTLRPGRALPRLLFTRTASPRTLSLAASLGLPRQRQPGRLKLSRAPANRLAALRVQGALARPPGVQGALARPPGLVRRERYASPTSATDSLHERPADCCVSGRASTPLPALRRIAIRRAQAHPGPEPSGVRSWETSLPAFPVSQPDGALA